MKNWLLKINPVYVTFEQAKLINNQIYNQKKIYLDKEGLEVTDEFIIDKYTSKGLPIPPINEIDIAKSVWSVSFLAKPEQWQVIEWLEMNYQKYVYAFRYNGIWQYKIDAEHGTDYFSTGEGFKSKQEAYSAAFDYTFKELINYHL